MTHFIYWLYAIDNRNNTVVKKMRGNSKETLIERFEKWFIRSNFDGSYSDIRIEFDYVQHANIRCERKEII